MSALRLILILTVAASSTRPAAARLTQPQGLQRTVYDLRDLSALLPMQEKPAVTSRRKSGSPFADDSEPSAPTRAPTEGLVAMLADSLDLGASELFPGVFVIEGAASSHEQFEGLINQTRGLFTARYEIEVMGIIMEDAPPAIGSTLEAAHPEWRFRRVATAGFPVRLEMERTRSSFADWQPVVGDTAVGFDPTRKDISDGVVIDARIDQVAGDPRLALRGSASRATLDQSAITHASVSGTYELPFTEVTTERRPFESALTLGTERTTVFAIVPAFEGTNSLVIAVTIRPL